MKFDSAIQEVLISRQVKFAKLFKMMGWVLRATLAMVILELFYKLEVLNLIAFLLSLVNFWLFARGVALYPIGFKIWRYRILGAFYILTAVFALWISSPDIVHQANMYLEVLRLTLFF